MGGNHADRQRNKEVDARKRNSQRAKTPCSNLKHGENENGGVDTLRIGKTREKKNRREMNGGQGESGEKN